MPFIGLQAQQAEAQNAAREQAEREAAAARAALEARQLAQLGARRAELERVDQQLDRSHVARQQAAHADAQAILSQLPIDPALVEAAEAARAELQEVTRAIGELERTIAELEQRTPVSLEEAEADQAALARQRQALAAHWRMAGPIRARAEQSAAQVTAARRQALSAQIGELERRRAQAHADARARVSQLLAELAEAQQARAAAEVQQTLDRLRSAAGFLG